MRGGGGYDESKMGESKREEEMRTGLNSRRRNHAAVHRGEGSDFHDGQHTGHLSDHEDDSKDTEEEHDLEIVANHNFGSEHDKLLHEINIIQCIVLVSIDSVTQHASLHKHVRTLESLPMAVTNIPAFTSTRLVDYLKTFVHLVRGGSDGDATTNPTTQAWQMSNVMKVIHIMATGSHHLRRKMNMHASEEIRFYLCQRKFVDNIDPHVL